MAWPPEIIHGYRDNNGIKDRPTDTSGNAMFHKVVEKFSHDKCALTLVLFELKYDKYSMNARKNIPLIKINDTHFLI